jgi:hypothetical protein
MRAYRILDNPLIRDQWPVVRSIERVREFMASLTDRLRI